jgi:hypothetical protein
MADSAQEKRSEVATNKEVALTNSYTDTAMAFADPEKSVSASEISASELPKADKQFLHSATLESYNPPPEQSDWDSFASAINSVMQYSMDAVDKKTAIRNQIAPRYNSVYKTTKNDENAIGGNGRITQDVYANNVARIENPYDKDMARELQSVIMDIKESNQWILRRGSKDEQAAIDDSNALLEYVDNRRAKGETVTGGDIYAKARELAGISQSLSPRFMTEDVVAESITVGGKTYSVGDTETFDDGREYRFTGNDNWEIVNADNR